jgi:hypothetical protein
LYQNYQLFNTFFFVCLQLWVAPICVAVALILMILEIGVAAVAGLGLMLTMLPVQSILARKAGTAKRQMLKFTDERVKLISEILNGKIYK